MPLPGPARAAMPALGALAVLAAAATLAPGTAAAGALAAWLFALSVTTGAGLWLLIARLTGGRWPGAAPALPALARLTPLIAPAGVLLFLAGPLLYPWWEGVPGLRGEVYLVPWSFGLRGAGILALWSLIGWLAPRGPGPVVAAVLLTAYGISVGLAGLDWVLSRDPDMLSTAFGMLLAAMQLGLALAVAAAAGLDARAPQGVADCGGLLLACCLGSFYLAAMQFLVSWSGNLPFKAAWFGARTDATGTAVIVTALVLGVLMPFAALLGTSARGSPAVLRAAGASVAAGGVLHLVWLAAPGAMAGALVVAAALVLPAALAVPSILQGSARHG
ncbi:hypothetical protein RISW2_03605 [Roseivivax isoporae LMG 25204]|uniref:Uncharacterized protein n=2 Tax=Roseivivax TaxID=93682 RepID=X7F8E6_9RHOB|nr:hypothetical protein RISW2_03605 [Roseivivax isoporae LMG 25204]